MTAPPPAGVRRTRSHLLHVAAWAVIAPLFGVALARVFAWDSRSVLVALNSLTPLLYLPAWLVTVGAAVARRWALLAVAAMVVVAHVIFALPELLAATPLPASARSAPTFTVFSANVYAGNHQFDAYAHEIRGHRPDIVMLQEATPAFVAGLDATGALADLPHRLTVSRTDPFSALVASRWPLVDDDVVAVRGRPVLVRATVDIAGTEIRLYGFHAVAPFGGGREEWVDDLDALGTAVAAETRPVLVAGDFNATWGHRPFRRLLDIGLTDAAAARAHPFQMTWRRDIRVIPPLTRLDHA